MEEKKEKKSVLKSLFPFLDPLVVQVLTGEVDAFKEGINGFYFVGPYNSGKTFQAKVVLEFYDQKKMVEKKSDRAFFIDIPEEWKNVNNRKVFHPYQSGLEITLYEYLVSPFFRGMLVLDDLSPDFLQTPSEKRDLYAVINSMYKKKGIVVVTSRCTLEEFSNKGSIEERIAERLYEMCTVVSLKTPGTLSLPRETP